MTQENDNGHKIAKYNRRKRLEAERGAMIYNPALPYIDRKLKRKRRDKRRAEIIQKALKKFK